MPGPTQPWDQSEDPRESTVDLPRLDLAGLADYFGGGPAPLDAELGRSRADRRPDPTSNSSRGPEATEFRHPYAEPDELPSLRTRFEPQTLAVQLPTASDVSLAAAPRPAASRPPALASPGPAAPPAEPAVATLAHDDIAPPAAAPAREIAQTGADPARDHVALRAADPPHDHVAPRAAAIPHESVTQPAADLAHDRIARPASVATSAGDAPSRVSDWRRPDVAPAAAGEGPRAPGPTEPAPAGSLANLRSRLARLPVGHPSSPYDDGGRLRPLPIRLRQLELGLPPPGRDPIGSLLPEIGAGGVAVEGARVGPAERGRGAHPEPDLRRPDLRVPEMRGPDMAKPDLLEPDMPEPDLLEPGRERRDGARHAAAQPTEPADGAVQRAARGPDPLPGDRGDRQRPARPDWADPYPAGNGHAAADLELGPWRSSQPPRVGGLEGLSGGGRNGHTGANGRGGPHHGDTSQHRVPQPPDRLDTADEDLRVLIDQTLESCRTAEGRNVFGGYGSSGLTPAIERIAASLPFGGLAPGSEADSLKSPARVAAKLTRLVARNPGRAPAELAAAIIDAVRYAFVFEAPDYVEGTWLVHRRFKSRGFELEVRRNRWESPEYKGILTQWRDPAHQLAFEVQFHTTASWSVVRRTHEAYIQITDPTTPPAERARLRAQQVAAAATAKAPPNCAEITDFRVGPR